MPTAQEIQEAIRQKNRRIQELEIQVQQKDQEIQRLTQEPEDARAQSSAEPSEEVSSSEDVPDSTEEIDLEAEMAESRRIVGGV